MRRIVPVIAAIVLVLTTFLFSYVPADACHGGCWTPCQGCYLEKDKEVGASAENAHMRGVVADAFALQEGTPTAEDLCNEGVLDQENFPNTERVLRGFAHRERVEGPGVDNLPDVPLCEFQIRLNEPTQQLPGPALSTSLVHPGEATVFIVHIGQIEFINEDAEGAAGFLRVVPNDGDEVSELSELDDGTLLAEVGDTFTLSAGASIYLDNQQQIVALRYTYVAGDPNIADDPEILGDAAAELRIVAAIPTGEPEGTPEP